MPPLFAAPAPNPVEFTVRLPAAVDIAMLPLVLVIVRLPPAPVSPAPALVTAFKLNVLAETKLMAPLLLVSLMEPPLPFAELTLLPPTASTPAPVEFRSTEPPVPATAVAEIAPESVTSVPCANMDPPSPAAVLFAVSVPFVVMAELEARKIFPPELAPEVVMFMVPAAELILPAGVAVTPSELPM